MNDLELEYALKHFDFSIFSRVRLPLLNELLSFHRKKIFYRKNPLWYQKILSDNELDEAAAAGLNFFPEKPGDSSDNI